MRRSTARSPPPRPRTSPGVSPPPSAGGGASSSWTTAEIVARLLKEELEQKGFEIQYAPDAEKATSIILKRATRPDLILLDINMPKVDGAQFCRFVKKNEMFRSIKVLFCTGEDRERAASLAQECGADGYILKDEFLGKWIVDNAG